jgi:hypothetical protein
MFLAHVLLVMSGSMRFNKRRRSLPQNRNTVGKSAMRISIRIRMFLGLPDPDPWLFCTDPDPSINKQKK